MIECRQLIKEFGQPPQRVLHGLDFTIKDSEYVSISGRSGSGKSTLLYIISTLDSPSSGKIIIDGQDISKLSVTDLHHFRNLKVGFVFQFHYLLPELTSIENILLPARNLKQDHLFKKDALQLLEELGVADQQDKLPSQMSGGQQQRVAIARALILKPRYLFADEPTGNLDTFNSKVVMAIIKRYHKEHGTTVALVTHEPNFAQQADREIYLVDGRISPRE
jgi:lipoprotein-releasing system ATP-binding protein